MAHFPPTTHCLRPAAAALLAMVVNLVSLTAPARAQATLGYQPTKEELAQFEKAVDLAKKEDLQGSIDILDDLMEKRPKWIDIWIVRGQVLMKDQSYDIAEESFQHAVDIDPKNRDGLLGLAAATMKMDDFDNALSALDKLLAAYPGDGQAALLRARVLVADRKMDEAAKYIVAILARVNGPERVAFLSALVPLQVKAGDFSRAEAGATEWIAAQPAVEAYVARADARRALKKFPEATEDLAAAFKLNNGQPTFELMYVSSQIQLDKGDAATAIVQLIDLLELSPRNTQVEDAIARAVQAREAQMEADPKQNELVPRLSLIGNAQRIEQWNLRALVGHERISRTLLKVWRAKRNAMDLPYLDMLEAMELYPAKELYANPLYMDLVFDLTKTTDAPGKPDEGEANTIRDFRIAAALAAVRYARHDQDGVLLKTEAEGYLQWAAFESRVLAGKLTESDKLIIKGHDLYERHDDCGALDAWSQASRMTADSFTGPAYSLSLRIKDNPERLAGVMRKWMAEVDAALAKADIKEAEKVTRKMENASSTDAMPKAALAKIYRAKGEKEKVAKQLESAVSTDAFCADAQLLIGQDLEAAGKTEEAMLAYNMGACGKQAPAPDDSPAVAKVITARNRIEKTRTTADLRNLYAKVANEAFASQEWSDVMAAATRRNSGFGDPQMAAIYSSGIAASHIWHYKEAVADLTKTAEMNPKMPGYSALASSEAALFHWDAALKWFAIAIAQDPKDSENYSDRGDVLIELEKYDEARADFEKAIKLGDTSASTKLRLGECIEHIDPQAAIAHYKSVIADPGVAAIFSSNERTVMIANARIYILQTDALKDKSK